VTLLRMGTAIVGRYIILRPIGHGGVSVVYEAVDAVSPRSLAVKVLSSALSDEGRAKDNVRREALITQRLRHPSVPRIYEFGDMRLPDGGSTSYLVMELLSGVSVADRLTDGPMPWEEAVRVAATVADVLAVAHRRGFVHRDLTVENIMLTRDGVKIIDFGLATTVDRPRTDRRPRLTRTTVPRRPVVPAHPVTSAAQPADDVYALGVLLYQMLTARSPYPGRLELPHARHMAPTPVLTVAGLPREVADMCRSCMNKRTADRPSSRDAAFALWGMLPALSPT
jgi:serine/threonine-protein kinase